MTGTGAFDFAVFGSPTVLHHTDRVTFNQPSDSSSCAGSYDSHVRPRNSPRRSPVKAAVATAVADGSERTFNHRHDFFERVRLRFSAVWCKSGYLGEFHG